MRAELSGRSIDLGPPKQRAVLAMLVLAGGAVVSVDRLIDGVWGDDPPANVTASLQAYISNLRKALRDEANVASPIVRRPPGYYLAIGEQDAVDLTDFETCCAQAREAVARSDWQAALRATEAAAGLRTGGLLDDLADHDWVATAAVRVEELHVECLENRLTALLALGRLGDALAAAMPLRALAPLRDRACWLHMLALYRSGRGPEALDAYAAHADHLSTELGLDPGPELRELQTMILRQSPELSTWPRSPAWSGATEIPEPTVAAVAEPERPSDPGRLVGRERELALLAGTLAEAADGATVWAVLTGPAGIGKTRLAEEATRQAGAGHVVWVNCPDEPGTPPWWPMRQLVRALGGNADEVLEAPDDADADTARFRVYERIALLLQATRGLVVVIDDAQWADPASLGALAYAASALREHPVAVILTVRDGERPPGLDRLMGTLARRDRHRRIDVPALSVAEVATLANGIADEPEDRLGAGEAAELAQRTGGNPFFVSEYARLPRAQRVAGDIPSAIRSVLDLRLSTLEPVVLQVLTSAAVVGDVLDTPAITILGGTLGLDLDTLADHLDAAADAHILIGAHGGAGYEFAHGLLREHLLTALPPVRRQRLHARVAEYLSTHPLPGGAARRAQHFVEALPLAAPADVVAACRVAAEEAAAQWSSETAARWWQAALDAYDLIAAPGRDESERDALTVALLQALARAGRGQTVLDAASSGLREALASGRTTTVGLIAGQLLRVSGGWPWVAPGVDPGELLGLLTEAADIHDPAAASRVAAALAVGRCYDPDPSVSARLLERSADLAVATGDDDVVADALLGRLITYSGVPAFSASSLAWVDELIALPHSRSREDAVIAHSVATMAAFDLADLSAVRAHLRAGIAGSEELRLPVLRAQLRWMEAVHAIWCGDFASAAQHLDTASSAHEQTELYGAGSRLIVLSCLLRELGQPVDDPAALYSDEDLGGDDMLGMAGAVLVATRTGPEFHEEAAALLAGQRAAGHVWIGLGHAVLLAHVSADHGLIDHAAELIARLDGHRSEIALIGQIGIVGPVALATARLRALLGERTAARRDLEVAEQIARRGGGAPSLLRVRLLACELDAADGRLAASAVAGLIDDAERLGMHGVAAAARRLLD